MLAASTPSRRHGANTQGPPTPHPTRATQRWRSFAAEDRDVHFHLSAHIPEAPTRHRGRIMDMLDTFLSGQQSDLAWARPSARTAALAMEAPSREESSAAAGCLVFSADASVRLSAICRACTLRLLVTGEPLDRPPPRTMRRAN